MKKTVLVPIFTFGFLFTCALQAAPFIRGDANQDGAHDVADAIVILSYLFQGGATTCSDAMDVNDDGKTDISDPVSLLGHLFRGRAAPPSPFPGCGEDPTEDQSTCELFDTEICPVEPKLRITGVTPAVGPPDGGTALVITGEGFEGTNTQAYLCSRLLLNLEVISDSRLEGVTPPGDPEKSCNLRVTNKYGEAVLSGAFTYEQESPPECYSEEDLAAVIDLYLGEPLCMPSPAYEGDLLGTPIVACPEGCCECTNGVAGCEAVMDEVDVAVDFDNETATAAFSASAAIPIDAGQTRCDTEFTMEGTASIDFALSDTEWEEVYEITEVSNLRFEVTTLTADSEGGFVCAVLEGAAGTFKTILEEEINKRSGEFLDALREELIGNYVCP